jgi:hypothetical protein
LAKGRVDVRESLFPIERGGRESPESVKTIILGHSPDAIPKEGAQFGSGLRIGKNFAVDVAV